MTDRLAGAREALAQLQDLRQRTDSAIGALAQLLGVAPDPTPLKHELAARDVRPGQSWAFRDHKTQAEIGGETKGLGERRSPRGRKAAKARRARSAALGGRPRKAARVAAKSRNPGRDADIERRWKAGEPTGNIAEAHGISGARVCQIAKALGLEARGRSRKTAAPASGRRPESFLPKDETQGAALTERELLKFLKEAGHVTYGPDDEGHYTVDRKTGLDAVGLLEIANLWRKRHGQPPLRLNKE